MGPEGASGPGSCSPALRLSPPTEARRKTEHWLLGRGNDKLGDGVHHFDLPAVTTCPGATDLCLLNCYARRGRFRTGGVKARLERNLEASRGRDFVTRMTAEIRARGVRVLRVHVSGDFYSTDYIRRWSKVAAACADVQVYAYTRSWRVPGLREAMEAELRMNGNFQLWYSADAESGVPEPAPAGVLVAWMQTAPDEVVLPGVELVFRTRPARKQAPPKKRTALPLVCPTECDRPASREMSCTSCGFCYA